MNIGAQDRNEISGKQSKLTAPFSPAVANDQKADRENKVENAFCSKWNITTYFTEPNCNVHTKVQGEPQVTMPLCYARGFKAICT
jgi:hypothetical protein